LIKHNDSAKELYERLIVLYHVMAVLYAFVMVLNCTVMMSHRRGAEHARPGISLILAHEAGLRLFLRV